MKIDFFQREFIVKKFWESLSFEIHERRKKSWRKKAGGSGFRHPEGDTCRSRYKDGDNNDWHQTVLFIGKSFRAFGRVMLRVGDLSLE